MKVGDVLVVKLRKCTAFSFEEMMLCIQAPDSWCYHTNIRECHNSKNNIRRVVYINKTHIFYICYLIICFLWTSSSSSSSSFYLANHYLQTQKHQ